MKKQTAKQQQGCTRSVANPEPAEKDSMAEEATPPANWRDAANREFEEEAAAAWAASEKLTEKKPPLDEDTIDRMAYKHFMEIKQKFAEQSQWTRRSELEENDTEFETVRMEVWDLLDEADRLQERIDKYERRENQSLDEDCKADELRKQVATLREVVCAALDAWDEQRKAGKKAPAEGLLYRYQQSKEAVVSQPGRDNMDFKNLTIERRQDLALQWFGDEGGDAKRKPLPIKEGQASWALNRGTRGALARVVERYKQAGIKESSEKTVRLDICAALDRRDGKPQTSAFPPNKFRRSLAAS